MSPPVLRLNMLIIGGVLSAAGFSLILLNLGNGFFTASAGVFTIALAIATPTSEGVTLGSEGSSAPRLVVNKGVVRTTIYQLNFCEKRLAMRKLASVNITVILALTLAIVGFLVDAAPIGALSGGLTGYSFQEYLTQKNRDRIGRSPSSNRKGRGDLELEYDSMDKVRLRGSGILFFLPNEVIRVSLPRGYADRMRSSVESIFGDMYEEAPS